MARDLTSVSCGGILLLPEQLRTAGPERNNLLVGRCHCDKVFSSSVDGLWFLSPPSMPQEALSKPLGFVAFRPVLHPLPLHSD